MAVIYRSPETEKEFENYFKFRWQQLRKPLGLEPGSEQDALDNSAVHIVAFNNGKIIGAGRLQFEQDATARIRYMAVDVDFRNQGIGSNLLKKLEAIAKTENINTCWLLARETAANFYLKNNYIFKGIADSELEIKHHRMEKTF